MWNIVCDSACQVTIGIWSDIAVILAFIFTGVTFWVAFVRKRKDENIKTVMEISKQLNETEDNFYNVLEKVTGSSDLSKYKDGQIQQQSRLDELESKVIDIFNVWEWFALLVVHKEIKEDYLQEHFKDAFKGDYEDILSKFPRLYKNEEEFPEVKRLYKIWSKKTGFWP